MSYAPILSLISKFLSENKEGFHGASLWWELNLIMEVTKGDDGDMKGFIEEERTHQKLIFLVNKLLGRLDLNCRFYAKSHQEIRIHNLEITTTTM